MNDSNKNWFKSWFNSPYYHLLYKDRDEKEAKLFISNLINYLKPIHSANLLDIACGKGRHAIYMNKLGFNVDAFDLSENSINYAKKHENDNLHFFVNDIRNPLKLDSFDYAFNLFTSFGYFIDEQDNIDAICAISKSLKKEGIFIMDFMNTTKIIQHIIPQETKIVKDIHFNITKKLKNNFIIKDIEFIANAVPYKFSEQVKMLYLNDFLSYFEKANLKVTAIFGDYNLTAFNENSSDRLILVAKKL